MRDVLDAPLDRALRPECARELWTWLVRIADTIGFSDLPENYPGEKPVESLLGEMTAFLAEMRMLSCLDAESMILNAQLREAEVQLASVGLSHTEAQARQSVERRKAIRRMEMMREQLDENKAKLSDTSSQLRKALKRVAHLEKRIEPLREELRSLATTELERLYPAERIEGGSRQ